MTRCCIVELRFFFLIRRSFVEKSLSEISASMRYRCIIKCECCYLIRIRMYSKTDIVRSSTKCSNVCLFFLWEDDVDDE